MPKIVGWSNALLPSERKLQNLFYTVDNALGALKQAYETGNPLKHSQFQGLHFTGQARGYNVHMKLKQGSWFAWSTGITSGGEERERFEYPMWNQMLEPYDHARGLRPEPHWSDPKQVEAWRGRLW